MDVPGVPRAPGPGVRAPLRARVFGPVARFDPHVRDRHQRPKVQADGRGVQYLGDSLGCGLAEALPEQWPEVRICPNHRVVQAAPARPLALLDLRGDGAMAIGAVGTLGAGNEPRRLTQRWGRAIYEDLPALAGVVYRGAHQGGVSVAVWDRAGVLQARPGTPDDGEPLAGPRLRTRVDRRAWHGRAGAPCGPRTARPAAPVSARSSSCLTSPLRILPTRERGSSGHSSICLGALTDPMRALTNAISSSGSMSALGSITAVTRSPHLSSGSPTTAQSRTAGCCISACSTSAEYTLKPPVMIMSLRRSTMNR